MSKTFVLSLAILFYIPSAHSQNLDPADVHITLDQALAIAMTKAKADFPDLGKYILYSVHPRLLEGDADAPRKGALCWEILWEEKAFPHDKQLRVHVYMTDASAKSYRTEKGTFQKEHEKSIEP